MENGDIPVVDFRPPVFHPRRCGLNPNVAGFRNRAALLKLVFNALCVVAATICGVLMAVDSVALGVGITAISLSMIMLAVSEFLWHHAEFCDLCGAATKSPFRESRPVWCPGCQNLNDPKQILVGGSKVMDLTGPHYLAHSDPIPRFLGLVSLLGITDGASEVRMEPQKDAYEVTLLIGGERHEVKNPPRFIHFPTAQTVKAMAGLDLLNCAQRQETHIEIVTHRGVVATNVVVEPTESGQRIVFAFFGMRGGRGAHSFSGDREDSRR